MSIASRIVVMDDARIEQIGSPAELYDNPANTFVMGFLGEITKVGDELVRPARHHDPRGPRGRAPRRQWSRGSPCSASRFAWS